jgi:lipoprotein-anchoring transpeptidase ErfK/SrfK
MILLLSILITLIPPKTQDESDIRIVIRKSDYALTVLKRDSVLRVYRVAVGKNPGDKRQRGDLRTPEGEFKISQIQNSKHWVHDFGDGKGEIRGAYGPWFLRLHAGKWTGIGIHGTHDPASIGTMVTEGCVRLVNEELEELRSMVAVGTRVTITP